MWKGVGLRGGREAEKALPSRADSAMHSNSGRLAIGAFQCSPAEHLVRQPHEDVTRVKRRRQRGSVVEHGQPRVLRAGIPAQLAIPPQANNSCLQPVAVGTEELEEPPFRAERLPAEEEVK